MVSRVGFGCPVPRQPVYSLMSHTQAESGYYLRNTTSPSRFSVWYQLEPSRTIASVPSSIRYRKDVPMAFTTDSPPAKGQTSSMSRFNWCRSCNNPDADFDRQLLCLPCFISSRKLNLHYRPFHPILHILLQCNCNFWQEQQLQRRVQEVKTVSIFPHRSPNLTYTQRIKYMATILRTFPHTY